MKNLRHGTLSFFVDATLFVCVLYGPICARGQQTPDQWERAHTGEEYIIELNASSLKLEPGRVLRAQFRTILSEPESLRGKPELKFKTRLETIDFKVNERRYRFAEIVLLDPHGKVLQSYTPGDQEEWRILRRDGVTERLFLAAQTLPPFGTWRAVAYRFAEGPPEPKATPDLEKLIGTRVGLFTGRAEVGTKICSSPAYEGKRYTKKELLKDVGVELNVIGINADSVETINVKCEGSGWQPPRSLLIKTIEGEMLMLWDGVFLVLKRE